MSQQVETTNNQQFDEATTNEACTPVIEHVADVAANAAAEAPSELVAPVVEHVADVAANAAAGAPSEPVAPVVEHVADVAANAAAEAPPEPVAEAPEPVAEAPESVAEASEPKAQVEQKPDPLAGLQEAKDTKRILEGKVTKVCKKYGTNWIAGFVVSVPEFDGVLADRPFLPYKERGDGKLPEVGDKIPVVVINVERLLVKRDEYRVKVVVSRKAAQEPAKQLQMEFLNTLHPGMVVKVGNRRPFSKGEFVELTDGHGFEALLPAGEMSKYAADYDSEMVVLSVDMGDPDQPVHGRENKPSVVLSHRWLPLVGDIVGATLSGRVTEVKFTQDGSLRPIGCQLLVADDELPAFMYAREGVVLPEPSDEPIDVVVEEVNLSARRPGKGQKDSTREQSLCRFIVRLPGAPGPDERRKPRGKGGDGGANGGNYSAGPRDAQSGSGNDQGRGRGGKNRRRGKGNDGGSDEREPRGFRDQKGRGGKQRDNRDGGSRGESRGNRDRGAKPQSTTVQEWAGAVLRPGQEVQGTIDAARDGKTLRVRLDKGVEGTLELSEVSDAELSPQELMALMGSPQRLLVLQVDPEREKITFSLKRLDVRYHQGEHDAVLQEKGRSSAPWLFLVDNGSGRKLIGEVQPNPINMAMLNVLEVGQSVKLVLNSVIHLARPMFVLPAPVADQSDEAAPVS